LAITGPAAVDRADPGNDAVGALSVDVPVTQQAVFDEGARVEQQRDPLAHRQLALFDGLGSVALRTAGERALGGALPPRRCARWCWSRPLSSPW